MADIQPADKGARRMAVLGVVMAAVLGAVLYVAFHRWFMEVQGLPPVAAKEAISATFAWSIGIVCLILCAVGLYLWRIGGRVRAVARFPLPGALVVRDTVILEGGAAQARGKLLQAFGVGCILCALGLLVATWKLLSALSQ